MTSLPAVQDIQTYLAYAGWQRHRETWHGASIWSDADGREILVPANNDLADTGLRIAELLSVLTAAEERSAAEIVTDINTPFDDIQWYRTLPGDGFVSLPTGLQTLQSVRDLIATAARTVVHGTHPVIPRGLPGPAGELLQQVQLGPTNPGDHAVTVRIPVAVAPPAADTDEHPPTAFGDPPAGPPLGRQVGHRLRAAVRAAQSAATQAAERDDLAGFDEAVAAGVSANLCEALAGLAGRGLDRPFEITFRWGRGLSTDVPADTVRFPGGAATAIKAGAEHLRQLGTPPPAASTAAIVGLVESLHGQSAGGDWQITVRGDLTADGVLESARTLPVLLSSAEAYDLAIAAHRRQDRVRARGELSGGSGGHTELSVIDNNFDILERDT